MTQLEENNIKTQLSLLNDYIDDNSLITHYVAVNAADLLTNLKKYNQTEVVIPNDIYNPLCDFLSKLTDKSNWYMIDKHAKEYQIKNNLRMETIRHLRSGINK